MSKITLNHSNQQYMSTATKTNCNGLTASHSKSICASCGACQVLQEDIKPEVYDRHEEAAHLYAAEKLLYQYYWSEIATRLSTNQQ
jgi:hypothetical protein